MEGSVAAVLCSPSMCLIYNDGRALTKKGKNDPDDLHETQLTR